MKFVDKTGQRFGKLVVRQLAQNCPVVWLCECDCGNFTRVLSTNLSHKKDGSLRTASCGCKQYQLRVSPAKYVFFDYRQSAKGKGVPFEISEDAVASLTSQGCTYCGAPPSRMISPSHRRKSPVYDVFRWNGIDRIDSSKGYVEGNVVPCCKFCNEMKSDKSGDEFLRQVETIHHWQRSKAVLPLSTP